MTANSKTGDDKLILSPSKLYSSVKTYGKKIFLFQSSSSKKANRYLYPVTEKLAQSFLVVLTGSIFLAILFGIAASEEIRKETGNIIPVLVGILVSLYGVAVAFVNVFISADEEALDMLMDGEKIRHNADDMIATNIENFRRRVTYRKAFLRKHEQLKEGSRRYRELRDLHNRVATDKDVEISRLKQEKLDAEIHLGERSKKSNELAKEVAQLKKRLEGYRLADQEKDKRIRDGEDREHELRNRMATEVLTGLPFGVILRSVTERVYEEDNMQSCSDAIAGLYAVLNEKFPDKEYLHRTALVPHEVVRAQKIESIIERYSQKITETENNDKLSPTEKRDKINAYRLARERELDIEE